MNQSTTGFIDGKVTLVLSRREFLHCTQNYPNMIPYRARAHKIQSPGWASQIFRLSLVCVHKGNILDECWKAATIVQGSRVQALILSHLAHRLRLAGLGGVCRVI